MFLDNNKLKQTIFIIALFGLGILLFWLLKGFLSALMGAIVFYILLRRPFFYLTEKPKRKWPKIIALLLLMLTSFVVLVLPVALVSVLLSSRVSELLSHYGDILRIAQELSDKIKEYIGIDLLTGDTVNRLTSVAANVIPGLLSATASAVADVFVLYFLLYFMMMNSRQFEKQVREYLPFREENDQLLLHELKNQTFSNAIGIPVLAILQGVTAWLGYMLLGVNEPFFWAVITGLMSVLPLLGTTIIWVPMSIFLYASGAHWQGIGLFLYGFVIITNIDNVFRFIVQKRIGNIHPIVTFFGVLIGLDLFGFVGIVFGPLLISYFILLLKIYRNEFLDEKYRIIVPPK